MAVTFTSIYDSMDTVAFNGTRYSVALELDDIKTRIMNGEISLSDGNGVVCCAGIESQRPIAGTARGHFQWEIKSKNGFYYLSQPNNYLVEAALEEGKQLSKLVGGIPLDGSKLITSVTDISPIQMLQVEKKQEWNLIRPDIRDYVETNWKQGLMIPMWVEAIKKNTNACQAFSATGYFTLISALIADKGKIITENEITSPALYTLNIGRSSSYKSTVFQGRVNTLLHGERGDTPNTWQIMPLRKDVVKGSPSTSQGLQQLIADNSGKKPNTEFQGVYLFQDEIGDWFYTKNKQGFMAGIQSELKKAYDGKLYIEITKENQQAKLTGSYPCCVTLAAAGAYDKFFSCANIEDVTDGFISRFLIAVDSNEKKKERVIFAPQARPNDNSDIIRNLNDIRHFLGNFYGQVETFTVSFTYADLPDNIREEIHDFMSRAERYLMQAGIEDELIDQAFPKLQTNILKAIALHSTFIGDFSVSALWEVFYFARHWVEGLAACLMELSNNLLSKRCDEVHEWMLSLSEQTCTSVQMARKFERKFNRDLPQVLRVLLNEGLIMQIPKKNITDDERMKAVMRNA